MKKITRALLMVAIICGLNSSALAQPFINEINYFKKLDSLNKPADNIILFIGSSSFTNWKDVQDYFPGYPILNRGFGGSSLPHLIMYSDDIIFKYQPKQIVIYCGENDLTGSGDITGKTILHRFTILHSLIRSRFADVPILYVSMKPSPSREKYFAKMEEGNRLIKKFCKKNKHTAFADVYQHMFHKDGKIMDDIFLSDKLHMNKKGYQIWQPIIEPCLVK